MNWKNNELSLVIVNLFYIIKELSLILTFISYLNKPLTIRIKSLFSTGFVIKVYTGENLYAISNIVFTCSQKTYFCFYISFFYLSI